eukprot:8152844-Pyramimonas_sp.AAC.1
MHLERMLRLAVTVSWTSPSPLGPACESPRPACASPRPACESPRPACESPLPACEFSPPRM